MMSIMNRYKNLTIGVLALQGDYEQHCRQLEVLGVEPVEVRTESQFGIIDGLIIPGGESTTMSILLERFGLRCTVSDFAKKNPVWGTCAGMILLSKRIADNQSDVKPLGLLDIDVVRNGYGRQIFSFEEDVKTKLGKDIESLPATFIRAPKIIRTGEGV